MANSIKIVEAIFELNELVKEQERKLGKIRAGLAALPRMIGESNPGPNPEQTDPEKD